MLNPGTKVIQSLLSGYPEKKITMIYGPGASGKTTCCFLSLIQCISEGNKAIFIDTENGFNIDRFEQLCVKNTLDILEKTFLLRVNSYKNQIKVFEKLPELAKNQEIKLIIVDTLSSHYRLELKKDHYKANKAMDNQLKILQNISEKQNKIILVTNQVYQNIEKKNQITMVGGNMMKSKGDCLIELQKTHQNDRFALLRKHYNKKFKLNKKIKFKIKTKGIFKSI